MAQRLTGGQIKPRAAAWRTHHGNPSGRSCLPAGRRPHSVVYRHTRLRSSLPVRQTDPARATPRP